MDPDRAKKLIASMKSRIAKNVSNYEQSGNGDGMHERNDDGDEDNNNNNNNNNVGQFDLTNCIAGDKSSFLKQGDTSDLLYWWHVLEEAGRLQYTISILLKQF